LARFLGPAYLRNAFTKGTAQEIDFLHAALELAPGQTVLDVGCGPGRHALELARRGIGVLGVDASPEFIEIARQASSDEGLPARFECIDVRDLHYDGEFDAAICLCQGGFGLLGGHDDLDVFHRIVQAVKIGGAVAVSAFHVAFAVRFLEGGETFDAATGVLHERSMLRNADGEEQEFDLWTTCFTVRELELLAALAGLEVSAIHGVTPGRYRAARPEVEAPELLLVGHRRA
jgi:SAM-dependent methyltransferase